MQHCPPLLSWKELRRGTGHLSKGKKIEEEKHTWGMIGNSRGREDIGKTGKERESNRDQGMKRKRGTKE